ncbi:MAG: hypothetical protein K2N13_03895, partial [Paraprevotella sp.]|nr:hypothetical protein [Paraprevotella sp.]
MELKNITRSVLLHWMEKQKTLSPTASPETVLFADAARMLGLLSGLLAEMAEELVVAAAEASAPAETTASVEEADPSEGIIPVKEATVSAENTAVSTTVTAPEEEAVRAEETPASQPTDKERAALQQAARMDGDIQTFLDRHYDLRFNLLTETT